MPTHGEGKMPLMVLVLFLLGTAAGNASAQGGHAGESIYRDGVLPSGVPLSGVREGNASINGSDAACVSCHRRSGLGSTEGRITIPPVTGPYLFRAADQRIDDQEVPYVGTSRVAHQAYNDETLARAIRAGVGADGRPLSYLMPRYDLDDASMAELIAYLKQMTPRHVPGVTDAVLHFATIVTPDADPARRAGTLAVLEKYFLDKNAAARAVAPRLYATRPMHFRVNRRWELHVWELSGAPQSWEAQLRKRLAAEPVFAVISGVGGATWEPVHHFCEEQGLPCLFPNIDAPPGSDGDFYSLYFSRQVLLEAQLIREQLGQRVNAVPLHVVQIFRSGDVGEQAAAELRAAAAQSGVSFENRVLRGSGGADQLRKAISHLGGTDALVLWLRPQDLMLLPAVPARTSLVWMSGVMGGLESAPLPVAWRAATRMTYPFDLPDRRRVRVDYALGWFRIRQVPMSALQVQADTYLACGLLSETLNHMVDTFERDYLIERIEQDLDHRVLTGYYPRLTLAAGQRFASKGGYVVRFTDPQGPKLATLSEWLTPDAGRLSASAR
jgi:hypothetical protein